MIEGLLVATILSLFATHVLYVGAGRLRAAFGAKGERRGTPAPRQGGGGAGGQQPAI